MSVPERNLNHVYYCLKCLIFWKKLEKLPQRFGGGDLLAFGGWGSAPKQWPIVV